MTREQMIDVLEDHCNGNICDSCEFCDDCEKDMVFSEIVDEKLKDYVSRIDEKNTDKESQKCMRTCWKENGAGKSFRKSNKNILSRCNERCVTT